MVLDWRIFWLKHKYDLNNPHKRVIFSTRLHGLTTSSISHLTDSESNLRHSGIRQNAWKLTTMPSKDSPYMPAILCNNFQTNSQHNFIPDLFQFQKLILQWSFCKVLHMLYVKGLDTYNTCIIYIQTSTTFSSDSCLLVLTCLTKSHVMRGWNQS